ncbi:hypothetical protein D2F00_20210 [Mycobacteroides abscessus]|nr:hypothetical protein D2F00_20210 [Mycobacteroides abscessus]
MVAQSLSYPPEGVETTPDGGTTVTVPHAAKQLGIDPRTARDMIISRKLRGGALPRPHRPRWYVYADQLPASKTDDATDPASPRRAGDYLDADRLAELVALKEANLLLLAAQDDLQAANTNYRNALSLFMTPGHPGDLAPRAAP